MKEGVHSLFEFVTHPIVLIELRMMERNCRWLFNLSVVIEQLGDVFQ